MSSNTAPHSNAGLGPERKGTSVATKQDNDREPITIKKYANRRLYNTATSTYVTLEDLAIMVKEGQEFLVYDAKSGEDITRSVLTQIIFEEESKGQNLLPVGFLRQLISFYGDSMQGLVPSYLEVSLETLTREQERLRQQMNDAWGAAPFKAMEEHAKSNLAVFEKALSMFSPFGAGEDEAQQATPSAPEAADKDDTSSKGDELGLLRNQLEAMQKQLDKLSKGS